MNWDWDKLQEKRQRQNNGAWGNGSQNGQNNDRQHETPPPNNDSGNFGNSFKKIPKFSFPIGKGAVIAVVGLWLLSGIYIVDPDEQGVVLRFGEYNRTVDSGPHYRLPFPIESVYTPKVTQVQRAEIGFRSTSSDTNFKQGQVRHITEESAMLTGDENIVNIQFSVQYQIKDAVAYLFNVTDQPTVIRNAAEAAMREVIGNSNIDSALTDGKLQIQNETTDLLQSLLDKYEVGVRVLAVQMQDVHPPKEVVDAFKDVASAREDKSRIINESEAYRNEIIPRTRGQAAEIINQAEGYKETRVREAEGQSQRFLTLMKEYNEAKDVTRKRLYLEAMQNILSQEGTERIVMPSDTAGNILPHLPLGAMNMGGATSNGGAK